MIYKARITVYGEYLMHDVAPGLILAGEQCLARPGAHNLPRHSAYLPRRDSVRRRLRREGYGTDDVIFGNMPLGWGFASSSALALLHLQGNPPDDDDLAAKVDGIDREIHGFEPSGLDSSFHLRGKGGLYFQRSWEDIPTLGNPFRVLALLPAKERRMSLAEIRKRIAENLIQLRPLAAEMNRSIRAGHGLPESLLYRYAEELLKCRVYSTQAEVIIRSAITKGIVAKGVGGLYDKAILLFDFGTDPTTSCHVDRFQSTRGAQWLGQIHRPETATRVNAET